ncbi:MAG: 4Fe-4S dicluster domain-containing protein [Planctomycetota bacterium]
MNRRAFLRNAVALGVACGGGVALFRGEAEAARGGAGLRPPGARSEAEFLSRCIRCFRCADACPNGAIVALNPQTGRDFSRTPGPAEAGTPVIFPRRQACMLCQGVPGDELLCTAACPSGALQLVRKDPADIQAKVRMGTARIDHNICYSWNCASCGVCARACPFEGRALKVGIFERPVVDPAYCVGCGLCERACIRYPQAASVEPRRA